MPSQQIIDKIVRKALPEFEKGLRHALTQPTGQMFAFDVAKDDKGNVFSVGYVILPGKMITGPSIDALNAPAANPPGENQNAENTKNS